MNLSPLPVQKFFGNDGNPLNGGKLFTYVVGTTTKIATYTNSTGTLNTNPIILDYRGEANVWLDQTLTYKFVLAPATDTDPPTNPIWSVDNVSAAVTYASLTAQILGAILYPRTALEIAAGLTTTNGFLNYPYGHAKRFGALGDGITNDTASLLRMIASMPSSGGQITFDDGAIYMIDSATASGLNFSGKSNFKIFGNNSTIEVLSGQSVVGGFGMLYFTNCQDGYIENLVVDANRAGRTPAAVGAYNIVVQNSCARLFFKNVRAINAVIDGWTFTTSVPGTLSTYPTDITLEDCYSDNAYRNGLSVVGSLRLKISGGAFTNTNGVSPQFGIDVEPDAPFVFGNTDLLIQDCLVYGNTKGGIAVTGPNASPNTRISIVGIRAQSNGDTAIQIAQAQGVVIRGCEIGDHVGNASLGVIHVGDASGNVSDITLFDNKFRSLTSASVAVAALFVRSTVLLPVTIDGVSFTVCACPFLRADSLSTLRNLSGTTCTSTSQAVNIVATRAIVRNILLDTTTGSSMVVTGADCDFDGLTIIDFGASATAGIQFEAGATGSIVRNASFFQRTSIPAGTFAIRYNGVVPRILRNVIAKSAGTDFTATTIFSFISGTVGAYISDCQPDPFRLLTTWDPPNILNGGSASQDFTVTGVALLDVATATIDSDLQGMTLTAYVKVANTVTAVLSNNTGGAINIANSNAVIRAEKR